jgi:hypothetical protein
MCFGLRFRCPPKNPACPESPLLVSSESPGNRLPKSVISPSQKELFLGARMNPADQLGRVSRNYRVSGNSSNILTFYPQPRLSTAFGFPKRISILQCGFREKLSQNRRSLNELQTKSCGRPVALPNDTLFSYSCHSWVIRVCIFLRETKITASLSRSVITSSARSEGW